MAVRMPSLELIMLVSKPQVRIGIVTPELKQKLKKSRQEYQVTLVWSNKSLKYMSGKALRDGLEEVDAKNGQVGDLDKVGDELFYISCCTSLEASNWSISIEAVYLKTKVFVKASYLTLLTSVENWMLFP